ncbi:lipid droplet-associated protein [Gordonia desulfuricans]|uniref:Lipid droplet-associated protein n=1 Tax=Gordonia desulfuricans TaxID=89051 RepID=A0A7K3LLJ9_9ACTN|nr:lipid droplet-associated protein [Gordonia desulfuricans]NDK89098.1 lipid droplet-associated protein [Gordonia desulfuricans]
MVRAPYPARIAAGLIVTAIEETRKLPTLIVTLPMTAISQTLQAGMRAQQQIAELAIKGDAALEFIFDSPAEEPSWARFDEDEIDVTESVVPIESASSAGRPTPAVLSTPTPAVPKPPTDPAGSDTPDTTPDSAPADSAEATTTADPATTDESATTDGSATTRSDVGRFALYSSAPAEVVAAANGAAATSDDSTDDDSDKPEAVVLLDYDTLTLAQLRAKLRSVGVDDLGVLLDYEKAGRNRAPFVTMIDNRISSATAKRPSQS